MSKQTRKEHWYKFTQFFDGDAQTVMKVGQEDILLQGTLPPNNELVVCSGPTSLTSEQGLALQTVLEARLGSPVLLLTHNVQLLKLKQLSDKEANQIIDQKENTRAEIIQVSPKEKNKLEKEGT